MSSAFGRRGWKETPIHAGPRHVQGRRVAQMLTGDPHPTGFAKDLETMTFEHGATLASTLKKIRWHDRLCDGP
jgi:hypothetical protein